jgi:hypothetical protein
MKNVKLLVAQVRTPEGESWGLVVASTFLVVAICFFRGFGQFVEVVCEQWVRLLLSPACISEREESRVWHLFRHALVK